MTYKTEDVVRTEIGQILGLQDTKDIQAGVGQITTFNQLGIHGVMDKPDGWYIPYDKTKPALILECKAEQVDVTTRKCVTEIKKNCRILLDAGYEKVFGLLSNGKKSLGFMNNEPVDIPADIQPVEWYLGRFNVKGIDKDYIYTITQRINNCLHSEFGIKNLYHRMIFTACALVARRYGADLKTSASLGWGAFHAEIQRAMNQAFIHAKNQNAKLDILLEVFSEIRMNLNVNSEDAKEQAHVKNVLNSFSGWVIDISDCINSSEWRGEDVMAIFFNEFNRYKKKSESGQVFTPEHITDFMYELCECNQDSVIFDGTCGSGSFLTKAMRNMMREAGGHDTSKAAAIKGNQLYGIEFDREVFALACANMLLHKDGKTNLVQGDTRSEWACDWIKEKLGKKRNVCILMNPPYENKFGCMEIVKNCLDNVPSGSIAAIILPEKKLEKASKKLVKDILDAHRLEKIIKLPENLFFGVGVSTSIYIFKTGVPQKGQEIYTAYIEDDGLEVVKNQGRHDIHNRWPAISERALTEIRRQTIDGEFHGAWIDPAKCLSYQVPPKPFTIREEDFQKTALDYLLWQKNVNVSALRSILMDKVMYSSELVDADAASMTMRIQKGD